MPLVPASRHAQALLLKLFGSPESLDKLVEGNEPEKTYFLSYTTVNKRGRTTKARWPPTGMQKVVQPTVVKAQGFMEWKDEAFRLWYLDPEWPVSVHEKNLNKPEPQMNLREEKRDVLRC